MSLTLGKRIGLHTRWFTAIVALHSFALALFPILHNMRFTELTAAKSEAATACWLEISLRAGIQGDAVHRCFLPVWTCDWHYNLQLCTQPASDRMGLCALSCCISWSGLKMLRTNTPTRCKIWGASQTPFRGKWSKCHVARRPGPGRTRKKLHATSWDVSKSEKVHRPLVDLAYQSWIWYSYGIYIYLYVLMMWPFAQESLQTWRILAEVCFGSYCNGLALALKHSWLVSSPMIKPAKLQYWLSAFYWSFHAYGNWHH